MKVTRSSAILLCRQNKHSAHANSRTGPGLRLVGCMYPRPIQPPNSPGNARTSSPVIVPPIRLHLRPSAYICGKSLLLLRFVFSAKPTLSEVASSSVSSDRQPNGIAQERLGGPRSKTSSSLRVLRALLFHIRVPSRPAELLVRLPQSSAETPLRLTSSHESSATTPSGSICTTNL
jgi:hypothetical protein